MLNEELINVVNSGHAWAFVGSGASCMAGAPSWHKLLADVKQHCVAAAPDTPFDNARFAKASIAGIPRAFLYLEKVFDAAAIQSAVCEIMCRLTNPGGLHTAIAHWPFANYVTTNYDSLLELALSHVDQRAWTTVGNSASQNKLISREVDHVVWHPHGSAAQPTKNLRLIVTGDDYDELYASGSSTLDALDSVLRMKRIVMFGFGFRDEDLLRVLERIHRVTTPDRPAFAFLPDCKSGDRAKYRERFNIELISYKTHDTDHSALLRFLDIYKAFIITRGVQYSVPTALHPQYDERVTSLITHNRLISHGIEASTDVGQSLLTAFVLRHFAENESLTEQQLREKVSACPAKTVALLPRVLEVLKEGKIVASDANRFHLLSQGRDLLDEAKSNSDLLHEQFFEQLRQRSMRSIPAGSGVDSERVASLAADYFRMLGRMCGLAIAQQLTRTDAQHTLARQAAILDSLHPVIAQCTTSEEAAWLVKIVLQVLGTPSPPEEVYLGYLSQAYFGQHMLNADFNASGFEREHLQRTVFVLDASFLIHLLAPSAGSHELATRLYQRLSELKSRLVITDILLTEVAEHARYAWKALRRYGAESRHIVEAARRGVAHKNVFLESYLVHPAYGPRSHYQRYFDDTTNASGAAPHVASLRPFVESLGIKVLSFDRWEGCTPSDIQQRDYQAGEIRDRRVTHQTYRHDRQVQAEAEVVVIVSRLRNDRFQLDGELFQDAFFITHSRILDGLPGMPPWICMRPGSLLNWLMSVRNITRQDASALFDQILHELASSGIEVIPRGQLVRAFSGIVDAAKEKIAEHNRERRELIKERYGVSDNIAFQDVDPLAWPTLERRLERDLLEIAEMRLAAERDSKEKAEEQLRKSQRDDQDYLRLKKLEQARKKQSKRRARRDASRPKKKKTKKKGK
jgi:hypothetical protein